MAFLRLFEDKGRPVRRQNRKEPFGQLGVGDLHQVYYILLLVSEKIHQLVKNPTYVHQIKFSIQAFPYRKEVTTVPDRGVGYFRIWLWTRDLPAKRRDHRSCAGRSGCRGGSVAPPCPRYRCRHQTGNTG